MKIKMFAMALALCAPASAISAAAPKVVADIAPVHALVARAMRGVGAPELILPPGASPHGFALKPSQARALASADMVFWIGESLTPWMSGAVENLAGNAVAVELMKADGLRLLPGRDNALFEPEDHADAHEHDEHEHEHGEEADHDDHDDHEDHEDHEDQAHEDHAHEEHHHHHHHGGTDLHVWLDPMNGAAMLRAIAGALAEADPENAALYQANAEAGQAELTALTAELEAQLAPLHDRPYIVFHDAYQYFETRFGLQALGAAAMSDARAPGAARLRQLREVVAERGVVCIFSEPQFPPKLARTISEGSGARMGELDPLGATLEPGETLYPTLLRNLARDLGSCLTPG